MNKKLWWVIATAAVLLIIIIAMVSRQGGSLVPEQAAQTPQTPTSGTPGATPTITNPNAGATIKNSLIIKNQKPSSATVIALATLEKAGFVVIRAVAHDGSKEVQGTVLGASPLLSRGTHTNIQANAALSPAGIYYGNLYSDNGDKVFSTAQDLPLKDANGNPFSVRFEANVPATASQSYTIGMKNGVFSPKSVTVPQGSMVIFTNNDVLVHSIIFPALGGEHVLKLGTSYIMYTGSLAPGTYTYRDNYNTTMTGSVIVQ